MDAGSGEIAAHVLTEGHADDAAHAPGLLEKAEGARPSVRWQRLLEDGRYCSISELAAAERIERGYLGKVLQLTLLAPSLVEAIVDGQQGAGVSLPGLMNVVPAIWAGADRKATAEAEEAARDANNDAKAVVRQRSADSNQSTIPSR